MGDRIAEAVVAAAKLQRVAEGAVQPAELDSRLEGLAAALRQEVAELLHEGCSSLLASLGPARDECCCEQVRGLRSELDGLHRWAAGTGLAKQVEMEMSRSAVLRDELDSKLERLATSLRLEVYEFVRKGVAEPTTGEPVVPPLKPGLARDLREELAGRPGGLLDRIRREIADLRRDTPAENVSFGDLGEVREALRNVRSGGDELSDAPRTRLECVGPATDAPRESPTHTSRPGVCFSLTGQPRLGRGAARTASPRQQGSSGSQPAQPRRRVQPRGSSQAAGQRQRTSVAAEASAAAAARPFPSPFFTLPPHPTDEQSRAVTLQIEKDLLEALEQGASAEEKRRLVQRQLLLKAHPDNGGTFEASEWLEKWKHAHFNWFLEYGLHLPEER